MTMNPKWPREKQQRYLIAEAKRIKAEIEQVFNDARHWNRLYPEEEPIEPWNDEKWADLLRYVNQTLGIEQGSDKIQ